MASVTTSDGKMIFFSLDPAGWADMVERLQLGSQVRALRNLFTVQSQKTRGGLLRLMMHREDGLEFVAELTRAEADESESTLELYGELLARLICTSCHDRLIPGEVAICGACESKAAMDLVRLRMELAAEVDR